MQLYHKLRIHFYLYGKLDKRSGKLVRCNRLQKRMSSKQYDGMHLRKRIKPAAIVVFYLEHKMQSQEMVAMMQY